MIARIIKNRHGSARQACEKWLSGSLWGSPIQLGPDKFHIYGANRRTWELVNVEFEPQRITVVRHKRTQRTGRGHRAPCPDDRREAGHLPGSLHFLTRQRTQK
jgi:hypothetical protein